MRDLPSLVLGLAVATLLPLLLVLSGYFFVYLAGESQIGASTPAPASAQISLPPESTESLSVWCRTLWSIHKSQAASETAMLAWITKTGEQVTRVIKVLAVYLLLVCAGLIYV